MQRRPRPAWLLVPPFLACLVIAGIFGSDTKAGLPSPAEAGASLPSPSEGKASQPSPAESKGETGLRIPETPSLWSIGSSLIGVLLIGAAAVMLIARLKGYAPTARIARGKGEALTLRQSLKISARHRVHAIEFDSRILLLGECDSNLVLLDSGGGIAADEMAITAREVEIGDPADAPVVSSRRRPRILRPAQKKRTAPSTGSADPDAMPTTGTDRSLSDAATEGRLADFQSILGKARRSATI